METPNPYSPPQTDLTKANVRAEQELATVLQRFCGFLLDILVSLVYYLPLLFVFGFFSAFSGGEPPGMVTGLTMGALGFLAFMATQIYFLKTSGQTIGKKIVGTKIVDMDGNKPDLVTLIVKRYLSVQLVSMIPGIGGLLWIVDCLFVFRTDRRCAHDLVAGTQVVQA
jgi:uncharacterized RDD family membrane protein YckC